MQLFISLGDIYSTENEDVLEKFIDGCTRVETAV